VQLEQRTHLRRSPRRVTATMGQAFNAFKLLENGYIVHPPFFGVELGSTLLRDDQAFFFGIAYRQELLPSFPTLHDAAINPCTIGPRRDCQS
jgi:hypothetical protein